VPRSQASGALAAPGVADQFPIIQGPHLGLPGGNSGSPVFSTASQAAVGIHTNGGCGANGGTSFRNTTLWNAIMSAGDPGLSILNSP
jgi:hypothetical protein